MGNETLVLETDFSQLTMGDLRFVLVKDPAPGDVIEAVVARIESSPFNTRFIFDEPVTLNNEDTLSITWSTGADNPVSEVQQPTETELIAAIKAKPGRMMKFLCTSDYRVGKIFWLAGDTYALTGHQIMERFYMDLPGFMAHFRLTGTSAQEIFRAASVPLAATDNDSFQIEAWRDELIISDGDEAIYLDSDREAQLLELLLKRRTEREK